MPVFRLDVQIAATAYIRAANAEDAAKRAAEELTDTDLMVMEDDDMISGKQCDDPDLPNVSLSPAMTIVGFDPTDEPENVGDDATDTK